MGKTKKLIILPDIHVPFEDKKALSAVEKYMADETFDEWVQLGDFLDLDQLSRFNKESIRKLEGRSLEGDFQAGRDLLDRHAAILRKNNPRCKMTMLEGNHEFRTEAYIDSNPQLAGSIEVERGLGLKGRRVEYVRYWRDGTLHKVGKLHFGHGRYVGGNHAKKHADNYGVSIVYGHVHDVSSHSKTLWGRDATIVAQSLGCLCKFEQDYIGKHPKNWVHAFGVAWVRPDGHFNLNVVTIFQGRFTAPNGRVYVG